ncbi:B3 domain-containing protein Os01g0234100-like isoform X2 [Silene latifolia]
MPSVTSQANEFRSKLEAKYPSFVKRLVKSNVTGCFWMGLPQPFCRMHLPSVDTFFLLENENGKQYKTKYLAQRTAFSGGWREFSIAEKLSEGNVLVFHLVNSTKFKVYKISENGFSEVNGVHIALNSAARVEQKDSGVPEENKESHRTSSPLAASRDEDYGFILSEEDGEVVQNVENVKKNTVESESGNSKHPQFPTVGDHNGITTFNDFIISVDELLKKDYELPHHIKWSYYQLCSSQKSILHADLLKDINPVLVAGCIIETVDIANEMRICQLPTFDSKFALWKRKLKYLKFAGMNVRFLAARLFNLQRVACNSEAAKKRQQYMDLCSEHDNSENIIKSLQDKLTELRRVSGKRAEDIDKLETEIKQHELRFQEQVSAPW